MNPLSDIDILIIITAFDNASITPAIQLNKEKNYKIIIDVIHEIILNEPVNNQITYIYNLTNKLLNNLNNNLHHNLNNNILVENYNYKLYKSCIDIFKDYFDLDVVTQLELKTKLQNVLNPLIRDTKPRLTELNYIMIYKVIDDLSKLNNTLIIDYNKIIKYLGNRYNISDNNIINRILNNNIPNIVIHNIDYVLYYDLINILI